MSGERSIILMARRPLYGAGKRRLAAELGDLAAHRFQRFALEHLLRRLGADRRWRLFLALTPDARRHPGARALLPQGEGDLGVRMARLARSAPPGPVIIIGSDSPGLSCRELAWTFAVLRRVDAVLGPASDGGYWLVGLTRAARRRPPFSGVRWSTANALTDTLRNLSGLHVALLHQRDDVDDAASLARARTREDRRRWRWAV
jgi:rSAM/selenodomain-associated transferase 1